MIEPTVIPPGAGEIIGDAPDRRVEILSDNESLHATWSRFGPGREGAGLHIHYEHSDLFYVLDGELTVKLGVDEEVAASAGGLVRIPPLVVHGFRNAGEVELKYLNFHAPGEGFADYMRGLRDGTGIDFDQDDPEGVDGLRPASDAVVGGEELVLEADGNREALICDIEALAISETTSDPGAASPPRHLHRRHIESFYVLDGEIAFEIGDRELRAEAGTWVQVPAGVAHTFSFPGAERARFLTIHSPNCGFGALLRALSAGEDDPVAAAGFDQEPAPG